MPAQSAETIYVKIGPLLQSVTVDSLAAFAQDGKITGDFRRYAPFFGEEQLAEFRAFLTTPFELDPIAIGDLSYSPIGEEFLQQLGAIFQTRAGNNGFHAIRAALIATAGEPEGFTVLGFLQNFPTDMLLNAREALVLTEALQELSDYEDSALAAIAARAAREEASAPYLPTDLSQLKPAPFTRHQIQVNPAVATGGVLHPFSVNILTPQTSQRPLPVVLLATPNRPETMALAEFLASYGLLTVLPAGNGGRSPFLGRLLDAQITPNDFSAQPIAITATLNALENWQRETRPITANLDRVGIIGHSFGGYAALVAAGAPINYDLLQRNCFRSSQLWLNLSMVVQCQAYRLPDEDFGLSDPRIGAVLAIDPIASTVLGPESLSNIEIPVFLAASGEDLLTPIVPEQIHPFIWLDERNKYLLVSTAIDNNSLLSSSDFSVSDTKADIFKTLSLSFFKVHIDNQTEFAAYLTASYVESLNSNLRLIQDLTAEHLKAAYGDSPPIPITSPP